MKKLRVILWPMVLILAAGSWSPAPAKDSDDIEKVLVAVVKAFRTGDYETMGQYYDKDCVVVSSASYNPPVVGWESLFKIYQATHARLSSAEMIRENTIIRWEGKIAWVTYQWKFFQTVGNNVSAFQGHTTLVLQKKRRRWLIVHNHTSAIPAPRDDAPAS